jgi:predicted amino acid racemase
MAVAGRLPAAVDQLRIGEAIVLGVDPATREPIPGLDLHRDAVTVTAPVIECKVKPSRPIGHAMQDAFGNVPEFEDRGERRRAIVALGRQDAPPQGLRPLDPGVEVLGASSDHLILDVEDMTEPPAIGDMLAFVPGYSATLALFTSPYVCKEYVGPAM